MAFVAPEAVVAVPEAEAAAAGFIAWVGRFGLLTGAQSLLGVLFGSRPSEPATGNAMRPIADMLAYPQRALYITLFHLNTVLEKMSRKLARVNNRIGDAYNSLLRTARIWDAQLGARLDSRINYVNKRLGDAYNSLLVTARQWDAQLGARLDSRIDYVNKRLGDAYNSLLAITAGWVNDLAADTRAQVVRLDNRIGDAYNAALAHARAWDADTRRATTDDITRQVVQPTRATWPQITAELAGMTAAIGGTMPGLQSLINAVPRTGPATLGAAATDPLAVERVLTRAMTDCVIPNCRNLSKVGRDLKDLFGAVEGVALFAFIAEMIHNPHGAAREARAVLEAPLHATVSTFEKAVGV